TAAFARWLGSYPDLQTERLHKVKTAVLPDRSHSEIDAIILGCIDLRSKGFASSRRGGDASEPTFAFGQGETVEHYLEIANKLSAYDNGFDLNRFHSPHAPCRYATFIWCCSKWALWRLYRSVRSNHDIHVFSDAGSPIPSPSSSRSRS